MRILKSHPLLKMVNSYLIDSPQPSNLSYWWNFGSLLALCLVIQIITGVTLAMHYNANVLEAFDSVEHIMRDVNNGWLLRYLHSNTASAFFFIVYLHIGRGLYYGSYKAPRTLVWTIGTVIFILMMATAFLGYVLPYGQMSLWGATVITNLMSAIPWVGQDIVEFIWGGFSVNNATLNRFFALHYVLPFILAALALMHLIALHDSAGSGNPLGMSANSDRLPFSPYFIFKDLVTIFLFILLLSLFVFFMPNVLGDSENYVMANPMQTPPAIVPEWYLLPFYAILRSIPNKLLGVITMFLAILILLLMPFTDLSRLRGVQFRPLNKIAFFIFIGNFLILMQLGAKHVESPYIEFGQVSTVIYFAYFFFMVPVLSIFENTLLVLGSFEKVLNKKIRSFSSTTSLATNINPKKRNSLVSLSESRLILDNSYEINSFISMKRSFSSTTRTSVKETSISDLELRDIAKEKEEVELPFQEQLNQQMENLKLSSSEIENQKDENLELSSQNQKDVDEIQDPVSNKNELIQGETEDVVLYYVRKKKPTEKGPYDPNNDSDVDKYSANSTPTPELRERFTNNKEGLKSYFEEKQQENRDKVKQAKEALEDLQRHDYFDQDASEFSSILKGIKNKFKGKQRALKDREKNLKDLYPEDNPSISTSQPLPESSITTSQPLPESSITTSQPLPESSKRKLTDSDSDSEPTGKRQKTEDKPSLIDEVLVIQSTEIDMYDISE